MLDIYSIYIKDVKMPLNGHFLVLKYAQFIHLPIQKFNSLKGHGHAFYLFFFNVYSVLEMQSLSVSRKDMIQIIKEFTML